MAARRVIARLFLYHAVIVASSGLCWDEPQSEGQLLGTPPSEYGELQDLRPLPGIELRPSSGCFHHPLRPEDSHLPPKQCCLCLEMIPMSQHSRHLSDMGQCAGASEPVSLSHGDRNRLNQVPQTPRIRRYTPCFTMSRSRRLDRVHIAKNRCY